MTDNKFHIYKNGLKEYMSSLFDSIGLNNYHFKDIYEFKSDWDVNFEMFIESVSNDWSVTLQLKKSENQVDNFTGRIYIYAYEKFMRLTNFSYINSNLNISKPRDLEPLLLEDNISKYLQTKNDPIEWWLGHDGIDFIGPEGYTHPNIEMLNVFLKYVHKQENNRYKLIILKIQHDEFSYSISFKLNNHIGWIFLPFIMGSPGTTNYYMKKIDSKVEEINKKYPNSIMVITIHQPFSIIKDLINKYYSSGYVLKKDSKNLENLRILLKDEKFWKSFIDHTINNSEMQYWDCKETFQFWKIPNGNKEAKKEYEIKACSNIISFANAGGGVIFIGITNNIPRKIIGVNNIEDKKNSLVDVLNKYCNNTTELVKFHEFNYSNDKTSIKLLILIIHQSSEVVELKINDRDYRIPVRIAAKTVFKKYQDFKARRYTIKENNIEFIRELYRLFNPK